MLIIGFGNRARQGKDSAAEAIAKYYSDIYVAYASHYVTKVPHTKVGVFKFATALYQEVNDWLSKNTAWTNPQFVWQGETIIPDWVQPDPNPEVSELAPYGKHPKLLQWWGTDFRRAQDPDYWTKKLFESIPENLDIALITDVRFLNEADGIKKLGGYNVNVQRFHENGVPYYSTDRDPMHPSEAALDGYKWDFRLVNSAGHQALLEEQAITLAEYLRGLDG